MTTSRLALKIVGECRIVADAPVTAIPIYWMVVTSLKYDKEIYGYEATLIPKAHVVKLCHRVPSDPLSALLRNSVVVAVSSTVLSMFIACLGAYAIARPIPLSAFPGARSGVHVPRAHLPLFIPCSR